jgi:type II secretory ATPase GspE/PulE/Tfp pilus assembly ATPase PilB-like protein
MDESQTQLNRREQEEKSTRERAAIIGMPYLDLTAVENTMQLASGILDIDSMHKNRVVPLLPETSDGVLQFGATTQTPQTYINELTAKYRALAKTANFVLISNASFLAIMQRFDPPKTVVYEDIKISNVGDSETFNSVSQSLATIGSDDLLNFLVEQADKLNASDIHIENQRTKIRIRFRVDGALHPVADIDTDRYRIIQGALASKANISTASTTSQSGHMSQEITRDGKTHLLNIRVESVPTMYGQDAVLRLFNFDESMLNLDRLGLAAEERKEIDEVVIHPRGMVLMVGPTGSGKSTTLYSILNALNTTDRKIITLEDPIEYGITGISQIPVDTTNGNKFADELRSVLRLDPDVVMIGEIRDSDTARTAIQASITGHLVLSSFHANSTSSAFSRMIDMIGVNPIFSSAIRLLIAQRLVRRLDDSTKKSYTPDQATKNWMKEVLKDLPSRIQMPDIENAVLYSPVIGPDSPFGFKGRMVIMEQMVVSEKIQAFLRGDNLEAHSEVIEKTAKEEGMVTLLQSGVLAALRGETTLDEINRAI